MAAAPPVEYVNRAGLSLIGRDGSAQVRTACRKQLPNRRVKCETGNPSDGKFRIRPAQLAHHEDNHRDVAPHAPARRLCKSSFPYPLRFRAGYRLEQR